MKLVKSVLSLLSLAFLVSCSKPVSSYANITNSTNILSSVADAQQSTSQIPGEKLVQDTNIYNLVDEGVSIYDATVVFTLPEFANKVFKTIKHEDDVSYRDLYIDGQLIASKVRTGDWYFSDINHDGYRESLFVLEENSSNPRIVIYDIHNSKELVVIKPAEATPLYFYYSLEIYNGSLITLMWDGSRTQRYFDYATFEYSNDSKVTLNWQNMFDIESFELNRLYARRTDETADVVNGVYQLKDGVEYVANLKVKRKADYNPSKVIISFGTTAESINCSIGHSCDNEMITNSGVYGAHSEEERVYRFTASGVGRSGQINFYCNLFKVSINAAIIS